ncbi:hypothetical protein Amsp01_043950 [Amycolatopsis sp. NBRC 101858]|nr:hypothetical protein Amsp01_043950 [Amycolatopsis sp. NBRC 101858]
MIGRRDTLADTDLHALKVLVHHGKVRIVDWGLVPARAAPLVRAAAAADGVFGQRAVHGVRDDRAQFRAPDHVE